MQAWRGAPPPLLTAEQLLAGLEGFGPQPHWSLAALPTLRSLELAAPAEGAPAPTSFDCACLSGLGSLTCLRLTSPSFADFDLGALPPSVRDLELAYHDPTALSVPRLPHTARRGAPIGPAPLARPVTQRGGRRRRPGAAAGPTAARTHALYWLALHRRWPALPPSPDPRPSPCRRLHQLVVRKGTGAVGLALDELAGRTSLLAVHASQLLLGVPVAGARVCTVLFGSVLLCPAMVASGRGWRRVARTRARPPPPP